MHEHSSPAFVTPFQLAQISAGLPAADLVPAILTGSREQATALRTVVVAPPGTGKTTAIPPAVANRLTHLQRPGKVVVTQPRRMAARAAARRLAQLSGTILGEQVGYTVRGDRKVSKATRVEFVTTGVLLRRLISNPEAPDISAVILDEVHERQLDTDITFAMIQQLGQLRDTADPLDIVVMSATLDAGFWAQLLTDDPSMPAEVLEVQAVTHPLREQWAPLSGTLRALDARGVTNQFIQHVAQTVVSAVKQEPSGDVLVFLPGAREIDQVAQQLSGVDSCEVLKLLGSTTAAEQDRILAPHDASRARRIVLATNVAESALTVSGVRIVVDAGLDRQPRLDTVRGVSGLVTVGAAKASMIQRAGRAAREAPGLVIRCMTAAEFAARPADRPAEIRTADLTQAVLDLATWGAADGAGLRLPEPFPTRSFAAATHSLTQLGALEMVGEQDGLQVTQLGRKLARLPVTPRLGRALYDGAEFVGPSFAAEVVATLASDERADGADLAALLHQLRSSREHRWTADRSQLLRLLAAKTSDNPGVGQFDLGLVTALAFPHQIARRRATDSARSEQYLLASGTAASLPRGSKLQGIEWLAIAELTLHGERAVIRTAAELDQSYAELAAGELFAQETQARFIDGKVTVRAVTRIGAIELSSTPMRPTPHHTRLAVANQIRETGVLEFFSATHASKRHETFAQLRARMGLLHRVLGSPWPNVADEALTERVEHWLASGLDQVASGTRTDRIDLASALRGLLPWPAAARFDDLAPERITVPSGSSVRLDWPAPEEHTADEVASPVLAVKLQECFGWTASPTVADGRVPVVLHLLSPARRPLAVTTDLASFWENIYPQVRAENRGRYVKHPWPENPLTAVATGKTNRALRNEQHRS